jgi:transcriptional regulator with XRE-family HTH domain
MSANGPPYYHFDVIHDHHRVNKIMIRHHPPNVKLMDGTINLICHNGCVPEKKQIDLGPIGVAVAANIEGLRKSQNLSYAQLSRKLTELGCPIAPLGLTRIREHQRRVDVDDLVALALALDVSPATLLLPNGSANETAPVTEGGEDYPREQIWLWLIGFAPIDAPTSMLPPPPPKALYRFQLTAIPDGVPIPDGFPGPYLEYAPSRDEDGDGDD